MFLCRHCADKNDWPFGFFESYGMCEICGKKVVCSDVHNSKLPPLKPPREGE